MFIVFEGIEGAGKTTQLGLLADGLAARGREVLPTREPGGDPLGLEIRRLLLSGPHGETATPIAPLAELFLLLADRAQHVERVIRPALAEGRIVLCDRFTASTLAYQGHGRGLDLDMLVRLNRIVSAGLTPDATVLLDLDPTVGLERARGRSEARDRIEAESLAFHARVRQGFLQTARTEGHLIVDATGNVAATREKILAALTGRLPEFASLLAPAGPAPAGLSPTGAQQS